MKWRDIALILLLLYAIFGAYSEYQTVKITNHLYTINKSQNESINTLMLHVALLESLIKRETRAQIALNKDLYNKYEEVKYGLR